MQQSRARLRLLRDHAFNPFDVVAQADVTGGLTTEPGAGSHDIALDDFPRGHPGQQPLVLDLDERRTAAVSVS